MSASKRKQVRIPGHTPEPEYAKELGMAEETLQKKRRLGLTSDYVMIGRMAHYVNADKQPWLERIRVTGVRSGRSRAQSRSGHAATPHGPA